MNKHIICINIHVCERISCCTLQAYTFYLYIFPLCFSVKPRKRSSSYTYWPIYIQLQYFVHFLVVSKHCKLRCSYLPFMSSILKAKCWILVQFGSVAQLCPTLWLHGLQQTVPPCPSPTPGGYSNSSPLSWWCHPTISSSVIPFSCLQSFPASGYFPMSQFFASGGQSIGASASASVLPMNIQDWFPLGLTSLISLQSKGLSRVFSRTTVQKHQFFGAQLSL